MKLRFLFVRAAAGTLAVGNAAPVNAPFAVQAQVVETASADAPAHATTRLASAAPRGDADVDAGDLRRDVRLKIGAHGELPCDSGEWANNSLFGPRAQVLAALGLNSDGSHDAARATALADAVSDASTGNADSSAFGSIFGNGPQPGGLGELLGLGGGTSPGGPTGGTSGTGGTGTTGGSTGGGPDTIGGGPTAPVIGGGTNQPGTGSTSGGGTTGGTMVPPIDTLPPTNPGDGHGGGNPTVPPVRPPIVTGAVPEPASWATMLIGFGALGAMMRRRRRAVSPV